MSEKFNQAIAYETLAKELYEAILKNDNAHTVKVEHNVNIVGKSGAKHQFDVFWEFVIAGITYRTCVECKFLGSRVKKSHITDFASKIEDIGNANGVFITNQGYQDGAQKFANSKNIKIILVNYLLRSIGVTANLIAPTTDLKNILFDKEFATDLKMKLGKEKIEILIPVREHTMLCDHQGNETKLVSTALREIKIQEGRRVVRISDAYLMSEIGPLKLEGFDIETTFTTIPQQWDFTVNDVSKAIMEDIIDDTTTILNNDGTVERIPKPN